MLYWRKIKMQKFIPLEELVEKEKLDFIESVENIDKYKTLNMIENIYTELV